MDKHFEIRNYEKDGITVIVQIDYDNEQISLVERQVNVNKDAPITQRYQNKKWMFVNREIEYMDGWRSILAAMEYAISHAEAELFKYLKEKKNNHEKKQIELQAAVVDAVIRGPKRKR
jgi:hypothetical protein